MTPNFTLGIFLHILERVKLDNCNLIGRLTVTSTSMSHRLSSYGVCSGSRNVSKFW